ncbi:hypothetical protein PGTUg99_013339 [Puccinia graminis f. sp. tritici]|uniref:Uncharacterized protein n=1 Tax=Puccinia graminis f. sp. tritici TaxID=56615 RepID=A0A5B0RE74_PUCGR|nr:hypothetical protein PGTUg99_013339 [Puccinia graminis f. sp. tritici]
MWLYIHSLVTSPCSGVLAAEAHSTAGQTGESRWVHRQLGLPNLTPLSTSSTRSEPAGLFPFPSALPPHAPGCHHNDQPASARAPANNRNSIPGLPLRHSTSTPLTDCRNIDWNDLVATKAYFTTNNRHMLPPCCLMNSPYES